MKEIYLAGGCFWGMQKFLDGDLCDEYVSSFTYTPVKLSTTIDHGINIDVTISLSNRITVKAKGKLILPTEKKASYVIY